MFCGIRYSYVSITFALTMILFVPQILIATYLIETLEGLIEVITSSVLTAINTAIIALMISDYLSKKLLYKFDSQPALLGSLIANAIQWLIFLLFFLEFMDHVLFRNNLINLYVFAQTISYLVPLLAIIYLSKE